MMNTIHLLLKRQSSITLTRYSVFNFARNFKP